VNCFKSGNDNLAFKIRATRRASHLSPRRLQDLPNIAWILQCDGIGRDHKVVDDMLCDIRQLLPRDPNIP
jgi:hypothetical protein